MKSPESFFVLSVLGLALLICAAIALYLDFEPGPSMWGGLFGVGLALASVVASFYYLRRSLYAPNLRFLKSFILSMLLRLSILLLGGVLVWKGSDWEHRQGVIREDLRA